jgi:hypothetical protein
MRPHTQKHILTAFIALAILILCPALEANTTSYVNLSTYGYGYGATGNPGNVGPYSGQFDKTTNVSDGYYYTGVLFCLDANVVWNGSAQGGYGTLAQAVASNDPNAKIGTRTLSQAEEEAAFLSSYAMQHGALPASGNTPAQVTALDGPVQYAIWTIMGSLLQNTVTGRGPYTTPDPTKTQTLIDLADKAYAQNWLTPKFLNDVLIWTPNSANTSQRFITYETNPQYFTPEPGTMIFMGTGVLLIALGRIRFGRAKRQ